MSERVTSAEFAAADDVGDWRILAVSAVAFFRTDSFGASAALVSAIAGLDGVAPDVDVRPDGVTVRLTAAGHDQPAEDVALPASHVDAARRISALAREHGATADPSLVQEVELAMDVLSVPAVRPFWCAVLGYTAVGDEDAVDPRRIGPPIWFQDMDPARTDRNRVHVDVFVPHDQFEARLAAALAAGGTMVRDSRPTWVTLADPEGNEADLTTWQGRD